MYDYTCKGCCHLQIILCVLIPTHGGDIIICGGNGIILYISVITIEFITIY